MSIKYRLYRPIQFFYTNNNKKLHIKLIITSEYLKKKNKIQSTKEIYKILKEELKNNIHSIQLLIN